MKALQITAPGGLTNLVTSDLEAPTPRPDEVVVRWRASSLNYHDLLVATGAIQVADGRIPMSDGAGEVVEVGASVTRWKNGDKVISAFYPNWRQGEASSENTSVIAGETVDGFACEQSAVSQDSITRMPELYSFAEAACLPCAALTAWNALMVNCRLRAGDSVLIEGTGGLSLFGLQIAKAAGATVIATTSSNEKAEQLKHLGADEVVNYQDEPKWGRKVHSLSGEGVDHVIDVGGPSTLHHSIAAARMGGNIVCVGILGGVKAEITLPSIFFKHLHIHGVSVGSQEMQEQMVVAIEENAFSPIIDRSFSLDSVAEAFGYQQSGNHMGKIVVEF